MKTLLNIVSVVASAQQSQTQPIEAQPKIEVKASQRATISGEMAVQTIKVTPRERAEIVGFSPVVVTFNERATISGTGTLQADPVKVITGTRPTVEVTAQPLKEVVVSKSKVIVVKPTAPEVVLTNIEVTAAELRVIETNFVVTATEPRVMETNIEVTANVLGRVEGTLADLYSASATQPRSFFGN